MNFKKSKSYLRVNLLGTGPRLIKKEFTGPRSHKGWETLLYTAKDEKFPRIRADGWPTKIYE